MELPQHLVDFIHGRTAMWVASRDFALMPCTAQSMGALVSPGRDVLTVYILEATSEQMLTNLHHNGQIAVGVSELGGHTAYQFKGDFVEARPSGEADYAVQDLAFDKTMSYASAIPFLGPLVARLAQLRRRPTVAIDMRIREVFEQTPRPGAGHRINLTTGA